MRPMAYTSLGRRESASCAHARAVEVAKQQLSVNPGDVRALYLAAGCVARLGRRKAALAWAARALALDGKDSAVQYNIGCLYAILGRSDEALRCLKRVVRSGWRKEWIKHDPDWSALRGRKEFIALISWKSAPLSGRAATEAPNQWERSCFDRLLSSGIQSFLACFAGC